MDPLGGVGFVCGVLGAMDLCARYGQTLMTKYETYSHTDSALAEVLLKTKNHWQIIEVEMEVLRSLAHRLDEKLQLHLAQMFQMLQGKLQEVVSTLDAIIGDKKQARAINLNQVWKKKGSINKIRFASHAKGAIDKILRDMDHWHGMLQPYWFLLGRLQDSAVDQQLSTYERSGSKQVWRLQELRNAIHGAGKRETGIFITESEWIENRTPILYTGGETAQDAGTQAHLYIESLVPHSCTSRNLALQNVRDLGHILSVVDPRLFCILACRAVIKLSGSSGKRESFQLVFQIPEALHGPRSLREILFHDKKYPLGELLNFAKQLARAVMFVHTTNFVHKNLRPETIIVFQDRETSSHSTCILGVPFLVGFQNVRPAAGVTYLCEDGEWQKNLYRHPTRQGTLPEDTYQMQHDIYSLGICLLELGLWESFIIPGESNGSCGPNSNLNIASYLNLPPPKQARAIKQDFMDMATKRLPSLMGSRYTQIVTMCLGCLDPVSNDFGYEHEFLDADGILVGVRYIEKVILQLEEIVV
ncbi:HET-s/LopB domain protein [Tirmania nivea]|nr:HET-s/LopB domain protein [Tirmania nivea]